MLSNTGSDIAHGLSTVGLWMPTSIAPHEEASSLFLAQLSWDKGMWDATQEVLTPIIDTCTPLTQSVITTKMHWKVVFPVFPSCARRKREWYDTLLGGTGTLLGVSNTIDNEVTRYKLAGTGQGTHDALLKVGMWLPNSIVGQKENAKLWQDVFKWELNIWNATSSVLTNVTKQLNWTTCSIQYLHAQAQKERFIRTMTTGNYQEWRTSWNISSELWLQLHSEYTVCNATECRGYWTQYTVTSNVTVCKFQVLPVITELGYWFLHVEGEWFNSGTNQTFNTDLCENTDKGLACKLHHEFVNPCLTKVDFALCDWSREPSRDILWQVGPHTLCVATAQNHSMLPTVPFVGCLCNVRFFQWGNGTYWLTNYTVASRFTAVQWEVLRTPWQISLERFKCALEQSTEIKKFIKSHASNVSQLMVSTLMAKGEILHAAKIIQQQSAHHWWDIFSGLSQTARVTLLPPMILVLIAIALTMLCNIGICCYVKRLEDQVARHQLEL
ncbi:uncharacterized protein LOC130928552 [Corythoichthys intestinalis]|uniref:uncharacterized protein LOC130928552 n=1 Tax=Corythoichthys intestinalis TaxID=161448 RepID=UPI0025A64209|nr:uncharacterized protein LOC130928552 [Corythoichthys intestinalis]